MPTNPCGRTKHRNIQVVGRGLNRELGGDNEGQSIGEQGLCRVMMRLVREAEMELCFCP